MGKSRNSKDVESYAPLQRIGTTDEVAGAAILLVRNQDLSLTGQVITMDGGITIAGRGKIVRKLFLFFNIHDD